MSENPWFIAIISGFVVFFVTRFIVKISSGKSEERSSDKSSIETIPIILSLLCIVFCQVLVVIIKEKTGLYDFFEYDIGSGVYFWIFLETFVLILAVKVYTFNKE